MNKKQMRVVRNIAALLINQLGTWTVTLVLTAVVPGYLGASVFGIYSFAYAYAAFFALGMSLGTGTYLTWRIAREPECAGRLAYNTLMLQIPLIILFNVIALALLPVFDTDPVLRNVTLIILLSTSLTSLSGTGTSALAGMQNLRMTAMIGLVCSALSAGLAVLGVHLHQGLVYFAGAGLVGQVLLTFGTLVYMSRKIRLVRQLDLQLWRTILGGGLPFFAWSIVLVFYAQIDIAMLKIMVGNAEVGIYAAAVRVISIPVFLPTIVITALLPALAHERDATSQFFQNLASRSIRVVMAVGIPAAVGTAMLSSKFIPLLHFPGSFDRATPLITILAFNMPMVGIDMVLGTILVSIGRQRAWTMVGIASALFNPLVNLWAIPFTQHVYGNGAIGASCVTLATEIIMFIGAMFLRPRGVFTLSDTVYIGRCILASLCMVPVILFLAPRFSSYSHVGIIVVIVCGVLMYAAAAVVLDVVQREDIYKIAALIQSKMGSKVLQKVSLAGDTEPQLAAVASVASDTSPVYEDVSAQPRRIPAQLEPAFTYLRRLRQVALPTGAAFRAALQHMYSRSTPLIARARVAAEPITQIATIVSLRMSIAAKHVQVRLSTFAHTEQALMASSRRLQRALMLARITTHIGVDGVARLLNILAAKVGFVLTQFRTQSRMSLSKWQRDVTTMFAAHERRQLPTRQLHDVARHLRYALSLPLTRVGSVSRPLTEATRLVAVRMHGALSQPLTHVSIRMDALSMWTPLGEAPVMDVLVTKEVTSPSMPTLPVSAGQPAFTHVAGEAVHEAEIAEEAQIDGERELVHIGLRQ